MIFTLIFTPWFTCKEQNTTEVMRCQFWNQVIKDCGSHLECSLSLYLGPLTLGEAVCPEAALQSGLVSEPRRSLFLRGLPQTNEWAWRQIVFQMSLELTAAGLDTAAASWRTLSQNYWITDPPKLWDNIYLLFSAIDIKYCWRLLLPGVLH